MGRGVVLYSRPFLNEARKPTFSLAERGIHACSILGPIPLIEYEQDWPFRFTGVGGTMIHLQWSAFVTFRLSSEDEVP